MMMRVPVGFRFRPTDEEVVVHYLSRRAHSLPLPASSDIIPDLTSFPSDPWSLPGDLREKRYYFWKRKGRLGNKCSKRMTTTSGFWKAIGKGKRIMSSCHKNNVVGSRKSWAFYQRIKNHSHNGHWSKTRWFMHEFQLLDSTKTRTDQTQDWVVYRIFQRKLRAKNEGINAPKCCSSNKNECHLGINVTSNPSFIDLKMDNSFDSGPPQPSSPSSTTDQGLDIHVETNSCSSIKF